MATSLAQQLKRLAVPQTNVLSDRKKRSSILFDPKEAAEKSREDIFMIGLNGLQELIKIDPTFKQFEQSLFDRTTIELQRTVEDAETNILLDKGIRRFMIHLIPYLLTQPAHMCLEWLIRRFAINEFNKNEMMLLILPYHETTIFVKCLQTMRLKDDKDEWHWLRPLQRPGVPLAKQTLFNHGVSVPSFLQFICKTTVEAAKELGPRAHCLSVLYAFYTISILGALDTASSISENHVVNCLYGITKGLTSNAVDFCAGSLMITAQLVAKTKLSDKFLNSIIERVCSIPHESLQEEAVILLTHIFNSQEDNFKALSGKSMNLIVSNKWIVTKLGKIHIEGISIINFYIPIMSTALRNVQLKGENFSACKAFCDNLLLQVVLRMDHTEPAIKCVLDNYILTEKPKVNGFTENETISLDSDNEDSVPANADDSSIKSWYSNLLRSLERLYPEAFDNVIRNVMKEDGNKMGDSRRNSLKIALGFLLKVAYTEDDVNVFENLYHHNSRYRQEAVKYLIENFEKFSIEEAKDDFMKVGVIERLQDEDPSVAYTALSYPTKTLLKIIEKDKFAELLVNMMMKCLRKTKSKWHSVTSLILQHMLSPEMEFIDKSTMFICLFPLLFPQTTEEFEFAVIIMKSKFGKSLKCLRNVNQKMNNKPNLELFNELLDQEIRTSGDFPDSQSLIDYLKNIKEKDLNAPRVTYNLLAIVYSLKTNVNLTLCHEIFDIIIRFAESTVLKKTKSEDSIHQLVRKGKISNGFFIECLECVITSVELNHHKELVRMDFVDQNSTLSLALKISRYLLTKFFASKPDQSNDYKKILALFIKTFFPTIKLKLEFFTNFHMAHTIPKSEGAERSTNFVEIDDLFQAQGIHIFNLFLPQLKADIADQLSLEYVLRIAASFSCDNAAIRQSGMITLNILKSEQMLATSEMNLLISHLISRSEELLMDPDQLPAIMFSLLSGGKATEKRLKADVFNLLVDGKTTLHLKAQLSDMLKYVNSSSELKSIIPLALEILDKSSNNTVGKVMSLYESQILVQTLYRFATPFDDTTSKLFKSFPPVMDFMKKSLAAYKILIQNGEEIISPTILALGAFQSDNFNKLTEDQRSIILHGIVEAASFAEVSNIGSVAMKTVKELNLNAKFCSNILTSMKNISNDGENSTMAKKRRSKVSAPSEELLNTREWKMGITLLEFLQAKPNLINPELLIPILFDILSKSLNFENQSFVEYTNQLLLSCILHICQTLEQPTLSRTQRLVPKTAINIDIIVQCIRGSQNPQTHHHALRLLCHAAKILPNEVLKNIIGLFTFMGSSIIRLDDAYSLEIISRIIECVIPLVVQDKPKPSDEQLDEQIVNIMKVFSDILLDVPEHRHLLLYVKLLETLDAKKHAWVFVALVCQAHVKHPKSHHDNAGGLPKRVEIMAKIMKEMPPNIIIETCTHLIHYLIGLPMKKPEIGTELRLEYPKLFDVIESTEKQLRYYKYIILQLIIELTSSTVVIDKIARLTEEESRQMKPVYQGLIVKVLIFIPDITKAFEQHNDKYWKTILINTYDILDNAILMLTPDKFLIVIHGLMQHKLPMVRKKVIELLVNKIQQKDGFFTDADESSMIQLLGPLSEIIYTIGEETTVCSDTAYIQQIALSAIKVLSKTLAIKFPKEFKEILEKLTKLAKTHGNEVSRVILANMILCLAEICANLKAQSISHLSKLMPTILRILKEQNEILRVDTILLSLVISVQKIMETMPMFLSPYLVDIVNELCLIWSKLNEDDPESKNVVNRLNIIWEKIAKLIPLRLFVPTVEQSYNRLLTDKEYNAIMPLTKLCIKCFEQLDNSDFTSMQTELSAFFLKMLQFRVDHEGRIDDDLSFERINVLEDHIIQAFITMVLKMSEGSFRPLFYKIQHWAIREASESKDRTITFYRLTSKIADALKSLFNLFAGDFVQHGADLLVQCNEKSEEEQFYPDCPDKSSYLLESIIKTFYVICLHDSQGFMNLHRFEIVMQPLVDQIENPIILQNKSIGTLLTASLAQLAFAVNDDSMWKQLIYQIMQKSRSDNSELRMYSLDTCVEVARKLGEEFMPQLPEIIPFLAELMEDENEVVEKHCKKSILELEKILGEPLQKHF